MENIFNVLAAILTSTAAPDTTDTIVEFRAKDNKPSELVDNLRTQLMRDNYDYMMEEAPAAPGAPAAPAAPGAPGELKNDDNKTNAERFKASLATTLETPIDFYTKSVSRYDVSRTTIKLKGLRRNPMYDQKSKYLMPSDRRKLATSGVDKVLYDDNESVVRRQNDKFTLKEPAEEGDNRTAADATVKYSVVKVNKSARRSASRSHLIKEEKQGEVSIVNLGSGTVPQFRLPGPRRQYMRDSEPDSQQDDRAPQAAVDLDR